MTTTAPEEWAPPVLPDLPDTEGWSGPQLEALALERCTTKPPDGRGHKARGSKADPVACKRCLMEVLTGEDPLAGSGPVDLAELYRAIPPPDTGFSHLHRRLLEVLADRGEYDLKELQGMVEGGGRSPEGYTTESISARLRDLRKMGYPIAQRVDGTLQDRRAVYRLAA